VDLYLGAGRIARPFVVDEGFRAPIGAHGLIGDGITAALVAADGSVDWLCFPRFDSPSAFAAILDPERGGCCRVSPARRPFESLQAYETDTNVLETLFRADGGGAVRVLDFMPWAGDPRASVHEVHRFIEGRAGSVDLEVVFDPRFDYGRGRTTVEVSGDGAFARGPNGERLAASIGGGAAFELRPDGGGAVARLTVREGQRLFAVLSFDAPRPEPIAAYRSFQHLRATRHFWRSFAARLAYDGPWRQLVLRSALVLKLLQYKPTGAVVAAPTASLPEWPGGERNWDYRYSWVRDSAMTVRALNLIGYPAEAVGFAHFLRDAVDRRGRLDIMLSIDGADVPAEEVLDHLAGHAGSRPVRIGNGARDQRQLDVAGALLDAAWVYERAGGTLTLRLWRQLGALVEQSIALADTPDHGIWEPRCAPTHHVHSKLMTWVAVDRALRLARLFGGDAREPGWRAARDGLRDGILARGYDRRLGTFAGEYDLPDGASAVDAALLLMPLTGFLPAADERVRRTCERIRRELGEGPFVRRYRVPDGVAGDEGAFVLCGFWLVQDLALAGDLDAALEVFHAHLGAVNHLGLLAEEVDPASGAPTGNFPQGFSHLGLIEAAVRLDLALRLRDEGTLAPPRHALDLPED